MESKKTQELKGKLAQWERMKTELAEDGPHAYYSVIISETKWDLEEAEKSDAKRTIRKALKHIAKKKAEIKELQKRVYSTLYPKEGDSVIGYSYEVPQFTNTLDNFRELMEII